MHHSPQYEIPMQYCSKSPSPVYNDKHSRSPPLLSPTASANGNKVTANTGTSTVSQIQITNVQSKSEENQHETSPLQLSPKPIDHCDKLNISRPADMEKQNECFRNNYYHYYSKPEGYVGIERKRYEMFKPYTDLNHDRNTSGGSYKHSQRLKLGKDIKYSIPYEHIFDKHRYSDRYKDHLPQVPFKLIHTASEHFRDPKHDAPRCSFKSLTSHESSCDKFSSDYYHKLPPKLHIVESQNKTGVTLTWNATSNCDSSLVKSYQLFARELFGYKVGTMRRIGIIDAVSLPMSCSIENLKCNIKYKFAVCAVDVYGRFGKMSNFTGKFEIKSKIPEKSDLKAEEKDYYYDDDNTEDLKITLN